MPVNCCQKLNMAIFYPNCIDSYFIARLRQYLQGKKCADMGSYFTESNDRNSYQILKKIPTISNLLSSAIVHGRTIFDPAWAVTLVLFCVAKIRPKFPPVDFEVTFGKNWFALLNSRLPSKVPSLFINRWVSSTGGDMAVEVILIPLEGEDVITVSDVPPMMAADSGLWSETK